MRYIGQTTWPPNKRWSSHKKCGRMMIKHKNGELLKEKYRGIESSALYNAMADFGIDNFTFEVIEDGIDEMDLLNETEKQYIKEFNCRMPNGYNMTNGGGSKFKHAPESIETMKRIKRENINSTRHEILHDMPLYFTYEKTLQAIILQKHPLCDFKGFYVRTHGSIEKSKEEALKFLNELEANGGKYEKVRKLKNSPFKGVYEIPEGSGKYYVTKQFKKKTYRRAFSNGTPEENKNNAIEFAKNPIEYIAKENNP